MSPLDMLLAGAAGLVLLMAAIGGHARSGILATLAYAAGLAVIAQMAPGLAVAGATVDSAAMLSVLGERITWGMDGLGWFFALVTVAAAFFASWFACGEWGERQAGMRRQHVFLALNVLAMLILLSSRDLLGLFIGWELVSWASFAMMAQSGGPAMRAATRYILYALAGGMAVLAAILLIRAHAPSFGLADARVAVAAMPSGLKWTLAALLAAGFGVKMGLMPFHLWQAPAYSETPGASSSFLNAISSRMGLYALIVTLVEVIGLDALRTMATPLPFLSAQTLIMWVAAVTMVVATFIALMQTDARLLLTWHGIGQGGYMLLGVLVATPLGAAGGLMHVANHATYQAALILSVAAVVHRAGTSDLDRLGGLITRMPLTYVTLLMGIIGLAGLPPMNGFVSKWMVYKSLIDARQPLLAAMAFIATLGTILSVYKLIHNIFLGQLREEHWNTREAPWSMTLPMLTLGGICFATGAMPGLMLDLVDRAQAAMGMSLQPHHLGGISRAGGSLDMLWVVATMLAMMGAGAVVFYLIGGRHRAVHQYDTYAGGHFLSSSIRYHFSHEFYPGLARVIGPWYRGSIVRGEESLTRLAAVAGDMWRGIFSVAHAPLVIVLALIAGLVWAQAGGGLLP
jgi:NADH-quinone oxidoreductase subunit M